MATKTKGGLTIDKIGDADILTGSAVKKLFGTGSVVVMAEAVGVLQPTCINGVEHCIMLKLGDAHQLDCEDGLEVAIEKFDDDSVSAGNLTMPFCYRSEKSAWGTAAEFLETLAAVCRQREKTASDVRQRMGTGR